MENIKSANSKRRFDVYPWHRTSIFIPKIRRSKGLDNLKIFDVNLMPRRFHDNSSAKTENEYKDQKDTRVLSIEDYRTTDKETLNYLKNHNPYLPYFINTVHLQNPYRAPQKLEGYALHESTIKGIYKSKETTLRSRYTKSVLENRNTTPAPKKYDRDDEKTERHNFQKYIKKLEFKNTVKHYCLNSTLHGLRYVGDSKLTVGERLFWIVSFIIAAVTAGYYIWFLYQKWISAPIIISLSPESVSLSEFPFPAVTVCNMNNVKKTEATRINTGDDLREKLLLEDICNTENNTVALGLEQESIEWNIMQRFMINVSQSCTDMIYLCRYHGNKTDCETIFNPTMTDEGICCNFNSVHKKHLFYNPHDWPDLNITLPFRGIDWNPEVGYNAHVPPDYIPWRPYGAGLFYGLTLVLDANIHEYYCSSTASVGFKMLLHNPVETPKIADFAFALTPGMETRVIVSPRISTANTAILSIPRKKRKCFFTTERKLRYYRTYTQRNCVLECEANFTQKMCDCVQYYMPKSSNTPICGKKDDQCATLARRAMELKLYDEDNPKNYLNITETPSCNCWPGCFELAYNMEISHSKLLSTFDIDDSYIKKSQKYFVENMAVVHIYFVESQFTKYVKNELFGFTEFLSSTGGLLGLFIGFSFLSFMEILYFATLRIWCRLNGHNSPTRTIIQVHPLVEGQNNVYPFAQ